MDKIEEMAIKEAINILENSSAEEISMLYVKWLIDNNAKIIIPKR